MILRKKILIDTIDKVNRFNRSAGLFSGKKLDLVHDRYGVNARSVCGIFSLDISKPIYLEYDSENEDEANMMFGMYEIL